MREIQLQPAAGSLVLTSQRYPGREEALRLKPRQMSHPYTCLSLQRSDGLGDGRCFLPLSEMESTGEALHAATGRVSSLSF